jgi:predicted RND superfamily exporter protein
MKQASFLARRNWGQPNYLLLALAASFLIALAPVGVQRAIDASANRPEQWLPDSTAAVKNLQWFRDQFDGERLVLVSWDGCTLSDSEQLRRLAKQLVPENPTTPEARQRVRWYASAMAGPDVLDQLTSPPVNLPADEAIARLEGVLVGPALPDGRASAARATCLAVELSPAAMRDEPTLRSALDTIGAVAATECGVDRAKIRLVGDPVADLAIDDAGRTTLFRLAPLAAAISFVVCLWRLGSGWLALLTVAVGAIGAMTGLALVFYLGVFEVAAIGRSTPRFGIVDALTLSLFAPAYVMGVAATLRLIRASQHAAAEGPQEGAVERGFRNAWPSIAMSAVVVAVGVASLAGSELAPLVKFSVTGSLAILVAAAMSLLITPVVLHRFAPAAAAQAGIAPRRPGRSPAGPFGRLATYAIDNPIVAAVACCAVMAAAVAGVGRLQPASHVPAMLDDEAALLSDYAWFEKNIGGAVPAEVVIAIPIERERQAGDPAEQDGQQYRLTPAEQAQLVATIHQRIVATTAVGGALSPATFAAGADDGINGDYRQPEILPTADEPTGRDLWRISARLPATSLAASATQYDLFTGAIRRAVEPVLQAYEQRDRVVQNLHERGGQLAGAKVGVLFRGPSAADAPPEDSPERRLADLLAASGVAPNGVSYFNVAAYDQDKSDAAAEPLRAQDLAALQGVDALINVSAGADATVRQMVAQGLNVVDAAGGWSVEESAAAPPAESGGPRPIRYLMSGMAPVAHATEQTLAADLRHWAPIALTAIGIAAMIALLDPVAGLVAMLPMLLPVGLLLGALGLLGVGVDLGVVTLAAVAVAVGAEATLHYFAAFHRVASHGLARRPAAVAAYNASMPGAIDVALVGCAGFVVLAASGLGALELLGLAALPLAVVAVVTAAVALPALAAGPLAWFFGAPALPSLAAESEPATLHPAEAPATPPRPHVLPLPADMRQDAAEDPHSALHAKLQRLRRSAGQ